MSWMTTPYMIRGRGRDGSFLSSAGTFTLVVSTGGASVTLEVDDGAGGWVVMETYDVDGIYDVALEERPAMRINPAIGAKFQAIGLNPDETILDSSTPLSVAFVDQNVDASVSRVVDISPFITGVGPFSTRILSGPGVPAGAAAVQVTSGNGYFDIEVEVRNDVWERATGFLSVNVTGASTGTPISATTLPTITALTDAQTPADGYVAGAYSSTAGTIVSAVPTYLVNGSAVASNYNLAAGNTVRISVLVTDSSGNTNTFLTSTITVTAAINPISAVTSPTLSALTDAQTPSAGFTDGTYTSTAGTIVSAVPTYKVDGVTQPGSFDLTAGEVVQVSVLVTDSVGNTKTFTTGQITVSAGGIFSEVAVQVSTNSLLDYGGNVAGSAADTSMVFADFIVPTASAQAFVLSLGSAAAYIKVNTDYTLSLAWGRSQTNVLPNYLQPGMRLAVLMKCEGVANVCQMFVKINGGAWITILNGTASSSTTPLNNPLYLLNSAGLTNDVVTPGMYRVQIWHGAASYPDLSSSGVRANFVNANGTLVGPTLSHTYGTPVVQLDGDEIRTGVNSGSGTDFTTAGTITTGLGTIPFSVSVINPVADRFGYAVNTARTSASVTLLGYTAWGHDVAMEAQAHDRADDSAVLTWAYAGVAANGVILASLTVPAGNRLCYWALRDTAQSATGTQTLNWTTALRPLYYGQSNSTRMFENPYAPDPATTAAFPSTALYVDINGATPVYSTTPTEGAAAFAQTLTALTGLPVMIMMGGVSGQAMANLKVGSTIYNTMLANLATIGGICHTFLWHQGESDVAAHPGNASSYSTDLQGIHAGVAAAVGTTTADMKMVLSSLGRHSATDAVKFTQFKLYQRSTLGALPNTIYAGHWSPMNIADSAHTYGENYARRGRIEALRIAADWGYATAPGYMDVSAAEYLDGTTTRVTLTHGALGTDFTLRTVADDPDGVGTAAFDAVLGTHNAFEVSADNSTWVAATPLSKPSGTGLMLKHADIGTSARYLRYAYGDMFQGTVLDNSGYSIPLELKASTAASSGSATWTETAAQFATDGKLDFTGGIANASATQFLAFASFDIPVAPSSVFAPVFIFGSTNYLRVNSDYSIDVSLGRTRTAIGAGTFTVGNRINIAVRLDTAANKFQIVYQRGTDAPVTEWDAIAAGSVGIQAQLLIGNDSANAKDFLGDMFRIGIWHGAGSYPDLTNATVRGHFWNADGSIPAPEVTTAQYGIPPILLDGGYGMASGHNAGARGNFTKTGTVS